MKAETKLALRRFTLRWLRKLVDVADDRLHAAEVQLREELSDLSPQKGESHDPRNGSARPAGHSAHHSGTAQPGQQTARSAAIAARDAKPELPAHRHHETFAQWEARRSGVAVVTKREARRRRLSAREFDLRFAQ